MTGIYVGVSLFQGRSIYSHGHGNPLPVHPFNEANNINGINRDPDKDGEGKEVHTLHVPDHAEFLACRGPVIIELPSGHRLTAAWRNPGSGKDGLFQNASSLTGGWQQLVPPRSDGWAVKTLRQQQSVR